ncbi:DUF7547 family protein [Natrarchaeobius oligotrophus]|uniref:Uncharacterized protein n=1 Tax=Natrarchaeobius chitinivorans TaxID=1679083 RepID=A0A3N6N2P3_NATCH|nr:hypothetical protein [Natrarchaeobius chitinivorans]RQH03132.1 hypothetical protein EA472_00600 [Natrarchaeobius chitinivorans]
MADTDEELAEAIRELARTIDELSHELESPRRRPPLRPPTPRELLSFTDEVAIPALLAMLNSSVRALEAFQRGIEIVRTEREVRDRTSDAVTVSSDRANELRRTTLSRLDTVLSELQRATSEGTLPADDRARSLLTDARELRDEVDERLTDATDELETRESSTGAVEIDVESGRPDDDGSNVDVDAELETLKDRYGPDDPDVAADESDGGDADETATDDGTGDDGGDGTGTEEP